MGPAAVLPAAGQRLLNLGLGGVGAAVEDAQPERVPRREGLRGILDGAHRGEVVLGGAQHQVVVPPHGQGEVGGALGVAVLEKEGPDGLKLPAHPRLVEGGEIGGGVSGDVPAVTLAHLGELGGAHAAGQPDLVSDDVGGRRTDAAVLQDRPGRLVVTVVAVVEGDGDDAAGGRGQDAQVAEPQAARGRVGGGDDLQAHSRHPVQPRMADDGALGSTVDGHPAPGTGAQRAHVGSHVQAQAVLALSAELELDALDLTVVLGTQPQVPLAVGHVDARQGQIRTGGAAGVTGGGDLQRLAPMGVGGGVGADGAVPGGEGPGARVLHIR